jgi:hypothetical protein
MTNWDFATAQTLIDTANQVTTVHAAIDKTLGVVGLRAPAKLRADYEYTDSDLVAVQKEANADLAAAKDLAVASAVVHGHHGVFATIGLHRGRCERCGQAPPRRRCRCDRARRVGRLAPPEAVPSPGRGRSREQRGRHGSGRVDSVPMLFRSFFVVIS